MMKKGNICIGIALAIIVGSLSMGCLSSPAEEPEETYGLTAKGLQVKADVAERQARGFVQYTGTTINITVVEVEDKVKLELPYIGTLAYPGNLDGFDTVEARLVMYEDTLNIQLDAIDGIVQQRYQYGGEEAYTQFYHRYYQDKIDDYARMYCTIGNSVIGDN